MKNILVLFLVFSLSGCASFGRGIAEAIMDKNEKEDTRQCEIQGTPTTGIEDLFKKNKVVKVMMIHGVGTHTPGYATRIRENLATALGLNLISRHDKDITLLDPKDPKIEIGNLRVTRMQNEEKTKDLIFYELTWSCNTSTQKRILDYDTSGLYAHKRAAFNHSMKGFLDDVIPDPMIYLMDPNERILNATKQSTCWMLSRSWDQLNDNQKQVCSVSSHKQIRDLSNENIIFITHSLGSRIFMDTMTGIVDSVAAAEKQADLKNNQDAQLIIDALKNKEMTVFMLANQLPLLQIGRVQPEVTNKISQYCKRKGKKYDERIFKKVNIVAFSDPNDLLSYGIPQTFVDQYMDSRMCPEVTNVNINIANEISVFGAGVVNPISAHTEYDNDLRVIQMISYGTTNLKQDKILSQKCRFTHLFD